MTDYRSQYALMLAEDRIRDRRREADLQRLLEGIPRHSERRLRGRRRWTIADLFSLLAPKREVAQPKTTTVPKPS
jgi:hypothetical protein